MADFLHLGLRLFTFLWVLLTLSLIGNVIADATAGNPSSINYAMFVSVYDMLVLIIGVVAAFTSFLDIPIAWIVADGLAALFTVIAGIVLAADLHVHSCGNSSYTSSNSLTNGSNDPSKRCHELQASTAFFWFAFVGFLALSAKACVGVRGGSSVGGRGGIRKGPSMTQV